MGNLGHVIYGRRLRVKLWSFGKLGNDRKLQFEAEAKRHLDSILIY